ncbi:actin-domain-containing protein [Laetiporus sulphureus 93-53]|uniref:Actin-domain-containing protein n=1 Tax=Laetiporus sulphureus 93-53 TaxID=1314785 RepID=A0A165BP93_9APHY|nr:actin-domain-containing protein [Laetiporus sulphureus 93-53]KZT01408.1 actin-domain-containing protein [Laetiporus sulphureus 93-53]
MSSTPATPRRQGSHDQESTSQATRASSSHTLQASPHYQTTRRHSLYGTEDRIIIDPGSHIWKVGFSGEGKPRDAFFAAGQCGMSLWTLSRSMKPAEGEEEERMLEARLQTSLRRVFHHSLMTDPKSRKVILVEHPLLPMYLKEMIARLLFENLQVPSVSFASSHLLALLAAGRLTGLVLDCGHLESTVLPIYSSRPLFPQLQTTPLAGMRLSSHIRALLLLFGTYLPPPTSLSAAANIPAATRSMRVPEEVLTDAVIEEVKTRCCFVGDALDAESRALSSSGDDPMDVDLPPSDPAMSESEFSRVSADFESNVSSQQAASSGFSVVSHSQVPNPDQPRPGESHLQALATMYKRHSTATDLHMRVDPPASQQTGTGRGTLIIPGWIRERAAEVLFEGGDVDESSVAEVILDSLLKVPIDLRKTLASSILVVGGTPMLPGFIPRLQAELVRAVSTPSPPASHPSSHPGQPKYEPYHRYASLRALASHFAILNNPSPPAPASVSSSANAGKAPAFTPAMMAWIGGSLAGALKTGGPEILREKWDEAGVQDDGDGLGGVLDPGRSPTLLLPDWTRIPLPVGAPPAPRALSHVSVPNPPQTEVGA